MNDRPRCSDWIPAPGDLDEAWAWRTLDGLGREAAIDILAVNPSTFTEALYYSKGSCFTYHLGVLLDYLLSEASKSNFAAAAGFMDLVIRRRPSPDTRIGINAISLSDGARQVALRQAFYEADEDVLGSFSEMYRDFMRVG